MDMNTRQLVSEATSTFLAAPKKMLIGANWVDAADGARLEVRNPATGEVFAHVPAGAAADVDRAVRAARSAFEAPGGARCCPRSANGCCYGWPTWSRPMPSSSPRSRRSTTASR